MSTNGITNFNDQPNPLADLFPMPASAPPAQEPSASAPTTPEPYVDVPEKLKTLANWVVWKHETRHGKPTKVPYDAKINGDSAYAKVNDSATWAPFERAAEMADILSGHDYDGIGFMMQGTCFVGFDFDGVLQDGKAEPFVLEILKHLGNPYCEITPSGNGLRAFVEYPLALPAGKRKFSRNTNGKYGAEIYSGSEGGRYFTVTGNKFSGNGIPKVLDIALAYFMVSQIVNEKLKALWMGDLSEYDGDHSRADLALLGILAPLFDNNAQKMEWAFSASKLGQRDKWTQREDYRKRSITAALSGKGSHSSAVANEKAQRTGKIVRPDLEFHTPAAPDPDGEYVIAPAEGQEDGWFPLGDISLVGGASGTGKTTLIFEMLYKQKQGYPFLGHRTHSRSFHVLAYDRRKNAFARTMRRLKLLSTDIPTTSLALTSGKNAVQDIVNEIEKMNPTPSIVFIEGLDMLIDDANKKSVVTPFMHQLQEVGEHFHIALIGSVGAPKTKRGEDYAAKRDHLSGSEAWGRNAETVAILEFSEEDDGTAPQRELTVLPRNALAEKFSLQFEKGRLVPVAAKPEEDKIPGGRPNRSLQAAITFLERELQHGPQEPQTLVRLAHDLENISRSTLYNAAAILRVRKGPRGASWELEPMNAGDHKGGEGETLPPLDFGDMHERNEVPGL